MTTEYWIDGYNVIGRTGWTLSMTLQQAREKLLRMLVPIGKPVRVFFDAAQPGAPASREITSPDPRVVPAFIKGRTADEAMLDDLRSMKAGAVTLVTDDRDLRQRARQLGANTLGVEKFLAGLETRNAPPAPRRPPPSRSPASRPPEGSPPTEGRPTGLSGKEVDEWMKIFGFDQEPPDGPET